MVIDRPGATATPVSSIPPPRLWATPEQMVAAARTYLTNRRTRDALFPGGWFADPAWDLLLDLFVSELEGEQVAVSSACIATGVPTTTALRCINRLVKAGLLIRTIDPDDARRSIVTLDPDCATKVGYWVAHALMQPAGRAYGCHASEPPVPRF